MRYEPEDVLMHELVAHIAPALTQSDMANGVDNENRARADLGMPLRMPEPHETAYPTRPR